MSHSTPTEEPVRRPSGNATRERILDALAATLISNGPGGVTLDSVATAASVSKGGLLHHFGSKQALFTGLAERLAGDLDTERQGIHASGRDPARAYLETSKPALRETSALQAVFLLLGQRFDPDYADAVELVRDALERFASMVDDSVDDPVRAATVRLIGDGIYFGALAGLTLPDDHQLRQIFDFVLGSSAVDHAVPAKGQGR